MVGTPDSRIYLSSLQIIDLPMGVNNIQLSKYLQQGIVESIIKYPKYPNIYDSESLSRLSNIPNLSDGKVQCAISCDCDWGPDEKTECRGREANVDNWGIFSSDTSLQALQRQVLWEELQREMYFVIVYRLYRLNTDPISRSVVH